MFRKNKKLYEPRLVISNNVAFRQAVTSDEPVQPTFKFSVQSVV